MVHVFGLQIKRYLDNAPITTATIRLHLNTMEGLSQASFCAIQVFHWSIAASHLPSGVQPQSLYLLRFSDASIMALNFEFSSASKAAGLSNSKIYGNEKNRAVISTSTYISLYLPIPRPKLFPIGNVGKESTQAALLGFESATSIIWSVNALSCSTHTHRMTLSCRSNKLKCFFCLISVALNIVHVRQTRSEMMMMMIDTSRGGMADDKAS